MPKQRIAILGGGIAGLVAAFELTNAPNWQNDFDITIYQLGWRLGGKCASGRNRDEHDRIEEHGLHILLGFYENAFRVIRAAYAELNRPPTAPLATWQEALKPQSYVVLMEQIASGKFVPWPMPFPTNSGVPGDGGVLPTIWQIIEMVIGWLKEIFVQATQLPDNDPRLTAAHAAADAGDSSSLLDILVRLHDFLHSMEDGTLETDIDWRRLYCGADLGFATLKGMIENGLICENPDFFKMDNVDFRQWLRNYGASEIAVQCAYIDGMYDLAFATSAMGAGAGTALNGMIRLACTYKGAVMWEMQAGMGDTIIAPIYQVLVNRGVSFEFFQRVDQLIPTSDGASVAQVVIGQQVTTTQPYQPLIDVNGLPCFPSDPLYEQLVQGKALQASGDNLEDWWTAWPDPVPPRVLVAGTDFDKVILACSVGVFPYIAPALMKVSQPLNDMVNTLKTTQTQAAQLWFKPDLAGLGWTLPKPVLDGYAESLDTWSDMTQLLAQESWGPNGPKNLAYLCSPLPDNVPMPPRSDHAYGPQQQARVYSNAQAWLQTSAAGLWPNTVPPGAKEGFDYSLLVGDPTVVGPDRLKTQYWIATWNPSDRYVLSVPGSYFKRLKTDGAGFDNLLLAGDYLLTGMNVGCVEAATMGGMHASQALCGRPEEIIGDST
ncbi:MAG TPA: NAD(P)-binding protein [Kofleriaceae bacterium]|jgi:uncharacterized protein with NAD-binding domain and iron-sulfur cluster